MQAPVWRPSALSKETVTCGVRVLNLLHFAKYTAKQTNRVLPLLVDGNIHYRILKLLYGAKNQQWKMRAYLRYVLAHANCTPFSSAKHLHLVTEKNSFFCHVENTVFQPLPKNAFFIRFAHFLLFLGGSNNNSLVQNHRVYRSFSLNKSFVG